MVSNGYCDNRNVRQLSVVSKSFKLDRAIPAGQTKVQEDGVGLMLSGFTHSLNTISGPHGPKTISA
jgi:hypothetical protein